MTRWQLCKMFINHWLDRVRNNWTLKFAPCKSEPKNPQKNHEKPFKLHDCSDVSEAFQNLLTWTKTNGWTKNLHNKNLEWNDGRIDSSWVTSNIIWTRYEDGCLALETTNLNISWLNIDLVLQRLATSTTNSREKDNFEIQFGNFNKFVFHFCERNYWAKVFWIK